MIVIIPLIDNWVFRNRFLEPSSSCFCSQMGRKLLQKQSTSQNNSVRLIEGFLLERFGFGTNSLLQLGTLSYP
jgi:hypothetical protein